MVGYTLYFLSEEVLETVNSIPSFENPRNSKFSKIYGNSERVSYIGPAQAWTEMRIFFNWHAWEIYQD